MVDGISGGGDSSSGFHHWLVVEVDRWSAQHSVDVDAAWLAPPNETLVPKARWAGSEDFLVDRDESAELGAGGWFRTAHLQGEADREVRDQAEVRTRARPRGEPLEVA